MDRRSSSTSTSILHGRIWLLRRTPRKCSWTWTASSRSKRTGRPATRNSSPSARWSRNSNRQTLSLDTLVKEKESREGFAIIAADYPTRQEGQYVADRPDTRPAGGSEMFSPVETGRMSGAIVDQVRDLIHKGQLRPGQRLPSERELAERFEVSRVTVRDALRSLETMGLVEIRVGAAGGAFLTAPSTA